MTARTALTPVVLVQDGSVALGAGTAIAGLVSGGAYVADPPGPNKVAILIDNTYTAAENVTIRAGGNGNTASGGTNPGVPFDSAPVGDLVVSCPNGAYTFIGPLTTDRYTQADGSLSIDFAGALTGTIWVIQQPENGIWG
jgi:hypothetical protein